MGSGAGRARERVQEAEILSDSPEETLTLTEQIRRRANEIWLENGQRDGSALADWLQAEQEILQEPKG